MAKQVGLVIHLSPQFRELCEANPDLDLANALVLHLSNAKQRHHMGKIETTTPHGWTVPDETLTTYDTDKSYHCKSSLLCLSTQLALCLTTQRKI
jgi:hypothetical protein